MRGRSPRNFAEAIAPRRAAAVATSVILIATLVLSSLFFRAWRLDREAEIGDEADRIVAAFEHEMQTYADGLSLLRGIFEATPADRRSPVWFARITRSWLARNRHFQGVAWLPRVERSGRADFERRHLTLVGRGLKIRSIGRALPLGTAHREGPWYPVAWIEPFAGNERALGVDIGSEPIRRAALEDAVASDSVRVSRGLALVQDPKGVWSHLVFVPIRRADGSIEGLVDGVVKVPRIIDAAAREVGLGMDVEVIDCADSPPLPMGVHRAATGRWEPSVGPKMKPVGVRQATILGHRYEFRMYSTDEFEERIPGNKAPYVAAIGMLLAAWVGTSLRRSEQRVREWRRKSDHDALTGALTRGRLDQVIGIAAADSRRDRHPAALLMVDIDHFKGINDTYGHPMGDTVLRQVARTLSDCLRAGDQLGRYGGEEFAVVLPRADVDAARECAERIRRRIEEDSFGEPGGPLRITVSIGLSSKDGPDPATWVSAADAALYRAKREGRNRVVVADS